jgi:hypothetical protein
MSSRVLLAVLLVLGLSTPLQAQVRRGQQARQPVMAAQQPTDVEGTIEGVMPGRIVVLDKGSHTWQVAVPAEAKVQVTGGATAEYLKKGMIVEFKAEIDDKRTIKDKVDELKVVTLSPGEKPGLFPPESKADDQGGFGAGGDATAKKPAKRVTASGGKGAAKTGGVAAGSYRIVGRLIVGHGGKLSVNVSRGKPLAFELSDKVAIGVDFADFTVASKGDKITAKVLKVPSRSNSPQAQLVTAAVATEVKIELAEPLVGAKKRGTAAKSEAKHPAKQPKKGDEGLPEPAAEK